MLTILRELSENPDGFWDSHMGLPHVEWAAGNLLHNAGLLTENGRITLAGMDYYRKETANPLLTWLRANWFAVIVAGCTIGVSAWGVLGG